jgi:hypothetical protein
MTPIRIPLGIHYLAAFGPMLAAVAVTAVVGGRAGVQDLARRTLRVRIGAGWLLVVFLSPLLLFVVGAAGGGEFPR